MKEWHCADMGGARPGKQDALHGMDCEDAAMVAGAESCENADAGSNLEAGRERFLARQVERWIASMERLQLSEYMRYVNDRRRMLWSNFLGGLARGVGTAVGFTILGAILVLILQNLAKRNLPLIGDALAQIVSIVQMRLQ